MRVIKGTSSRGVSHSCRQEVVSCYSSRETDLQSLPLLLMPLLHLFQLRIETLGRLPDPHTLLRTILDLRDGKETRPIRLHWTKLNARLVPTNRYERPLMSACALRLLVDYGVVLQEMLRCAEPRIMHGKYNIVCVCVCVGCVCVCAVRM